MSNRAMIIFRKEFLETLRDKRTLLSMILIPVVLYPALILIVLQVASVQQVELEGTTGNVVIVGEAPPEELVDALKKTRNTTLSSLPLEKARNALLQGEVQAVVIPAEEFSKTLEEQRTATISVEFDESSELSSLFSRRVLKQLEGYSDQILEERLASLSLERETIVPLAFEVKNSAPPARMGGYILGQILPLLLLITVVIGAFYPAVDLTAGEKERGTLQTLLSAPVHATDIVTGKFLAVCAITLLAGFANIGSVVLFFGHSMLLGSMDLPPEFQLDLSMTTWALLLMTVVVMGLFFSAVLMAVAVLARSFKEAQTFLTPVYFACLIPAMIAQLPGIELTLATAWIPGMNVTLLMRNLLMEQASIAGIATVLCANILYSAIALYFAGEFFRRESVLFGDHSKPSTGMFSKDKTRPWPSPSEGLVLFALLFPLIYYAGSALQSWTMPLGLILTLWGVLLGGTIWFLRHRKISLPSAFSLHPAPFSGWVAAIICGLAAWPATLFLVEFIHGGASMPQEMVDQANALLAPPKELWALLLLDFALTLSPGICEELVFRGALLNAFGRRLKRSWAIVLVGILFAALHFSIYRFVGTLALGIVAGIIVVTTGSVLPAILFHATHNAMMITLSRLPADWQALLIGTGGPSIPLVLLSVGSLAMAFFLLHKSREKRIGWRPGDPASDA